MLARPACKNIIDVYGPHIIDLLERGFPPDVACYAMGACPRGRNNETCLLFHRHSADVAQAQHLVQRLRRAHRLPAALPPACSLPAVKPLCDLVKRFADRHDPIEDADGDKYSIIRTLRGTSWRGKDCDDSRDSVHPGRRVGRDADAHADANCNGIYGIDYAATRQPYETLFCDGTQPMGVALFGDSAGAHFHIPPDWMRAAVIHNGTYENLLFILENEFDWPMLSATTAFMNSTWADVTGPSDSLYARMVARNRCMHRDYQNLAVNGARSGDMNSTIIREFARDPDKDYPVLAVYALIGNDVCSGHPDTDHMTPPDEFRRNVVAALRFLDTRLPAGSHVALSGLADGRILYESVHSRYHPLGELNRDVTYASLYDWLNCLQISPCYGWMNRHGRRWRRAPRVSRRADRRAPGAVATPRGGT